MPNFLFASFAALLHCLSTFKSLCMITPKSLSLFCAPSTLSPNLTSIPSLANPKCIIAHLSRLNSICQSSDHLNNSIRSCLSLSLSSSDPTLATNFVSSANLSTVLRIPSSISLINTMNSTGPNTDPWGTPLNTHSQPDATLSPPSAFYLTTNSLPISPLHHRWISQIDVSFLFMKSIGIEVSVSTAINLCRSIGIGIADTFLGRVSVSLSPILFVSIVNNPDDYSNSRLAILRTFLLYLKYNHLIIKLIFQLCQKCWKMSNKKL